MKPKFFLFLLFSFNIVNCSLYITHATVRFVSKTGSSTPPYTSWETASDSIQKCINICVDGDTIYVANGIYKETLIVNRAISLIGSSMDSTVIDGTGPLPDFATVYFLDHDSYIQNFKIIGSGINSFRSGIDTRFSNTVGKFIHVLNAYDGISINFSSAKFSDCIINNTKRAIRIEDPSDTTQPTFINSIIIYDGNYFNSIYLSFGSTPHINNNIIVQTNNSDTYGINSEYCKGLYILNNYVAGFGNANIKVGQIGNDTAYVINNTSLYTKPLTQPQTGSIVVNSGEKTVLKNNIIAHGYRGIYCYGLNVTPEYNLFWDITQQTAGNINIGSGNFYADPMFVNDNLPNPQLDFDNHLQAFSPAVDKGDPNILDVDSTHSDIGMYGGPFGETYTYQDLAPCPPRYLSAVVDTNQILLKWNHNTEADTSYYKVYRDTVINFQIDSIKLVSLPTDTFFIQYPPFFGRKYVYKITCIDNQGNESKPSEEIVVDLTSVSTDDYPMTISDYVLYQNYPNPFNPSTTIGYQLKHRSQVRLMIYDIKGELINVLVNKEQNAGYYEIEFNVGDGLPSVPNVPGLASGIYLYRIEVIGEGNIPIYTAMRKMILIK
jgi:hypothetical protein